MNLLVGSFHVIYHRYTNFSSYIATIILKG